MIRVKGVSKKFGALQVLSGVDFEVAEGSATGIIGPNGCGKSTLIKSILGLVVPDEGDIWVRGESVLSGWMYRRNIGYMPQNPDFPKNLKIRELLDMLEDIRGEKGVLRRELEELFELDLHLEKNFGVLSGGTKQKVAAVAAFMFAQKVLVLDEPTVGLDPVSAAKFKNLVRKMQGNGHCIILVTHLLGEIEALVQNLVFLLEGSLRYSGSTEQLKTKLGVESLDEAILKLTRGDRASGFGAMV